MSQAQSIKDEQPLATETSRAPSIEDEKLIETATLTQDESAYPSNKKRIVVMLALYLAVFLVTLDQNIVSTAIPRITDDFNSLNDVGWYGTGYILTLCSFQLLMGKIYKHYPVKPIFLAEVILFEVGSAVCGAAPNSTVLIVGRAIAGLGASGMFSGMMTIMFNIIPLRQRPLYTGAFGIVFALSSVIGPLVGGVFTDKVTWRWCFYINLPIGAVSLVVTVLILHLPDQKLLPPANGFINKVKQLDPIGSLAFFPGIVCLVLALQWGGAEYAWSNARIIVLLVLCVVLVSAFVGIQIWQGEGATVPVRIVKQRSIIACIWFGFFNSAGMMIAMFYLPIWFQAIRGVSATKSGIMLLPMIISVVVASVASGGSVSKMGYTNPCYLASSVIMPIGAGLLATLDPTSSNAKLIGYQIVFGFGLGLGAQMPLNTAQTVLGKTDISTGSSLIFFTRFLGSAIFLPVAQNIFISGLLSRLTNLPGIDAESIVGGGATKLRKLVSGDDLRMLLEDYNEAIIDVFYLMIALSAVTIIGAVFVEWRSLKDTAAEQDGTKAKPKDVGEA